MNPFGQSWTMDVRAAASWSDTSALFAEFRVWDVLRKTWLRAEQQFQKSSPAFTLRFSASLDTPRKAEVRVTRVLLDGQIVRGPWRDLVGPIAAISDDVKAERRIRATLVAPHFARAQVRKASVEVEYNDTVHKVHAITDPPLEFARDQATVDWTHAQPDPSQAFYRYRIRARGINGEKVTGTWQESGADDLTVTLPADPWAI